MFSVFHQERNSPNNCWTWLLLSVFNETEWIHIACMLFDETNVPKQPHRSRLCCFVWAVSQAQNHINCIALGFCYCMGMFHQRVRRTKGRVSHFGWLGWPWFLWTHTMTFQELWWKKSCVSEQEPCTLAVISANENKQYIEIRTNKYMHAGL